MATNLVENWRKSSTKWAVCVVLMTFVIIYKEERFVVESFVESDGDASSSSSSSSSRRGQASEASQVTVESGLNATDCSNEVISRSDELETRLNATNPTRTLCTAELFRTYSSQNGRFYGDGVWYWDSNSSSADFYPDLCRFQRTASKFEACAERGIRSILLTGDSNGFRYFKGLLEYFKRNSWSCTVQRREVVQGKLREKDYFLVPPIPSRKLQMGERGCTHCDSKTYECRPRNETTPSEVVRLEFIGMIHFIDSSLRLDYDMAGEFANRLYSADTLIEYVLKYYLPHHGLPDLWILSSPNHHEAWGSTLTKFEADLSYFASMLDMYWPSKSQLVVLPDIRECPKMVPEDANYLIRLHLNTTRNEKIHAMNQALYRVLKPLMTTPGGNIHGFLDLSKITCPVMCTWHEDGGHMKPFWYLMMIRYVFQLLCFR